MSRTYSEENQATRARQETLDRDKQRQAALEEAQRAEALARAKLLEQTSEQVHQLSANLREVQAELQALRQAVQQKEQTAPRDMLPAIDVPEIERRERSWFVPFLAVLVAGAAAGYAYLTWWDTNSISIPWVGPSTVSASPTALPIEPSAKPPLSTIRPDETIPIAGPAPEAPREPAWPKSWGPGATFVPMTPDGKAVTFGAEPQAQPTPTKETTVASPSVAPERAPEPAPHESPAKAEPTATAATAIEPEPLPSAVPVVAPKVELRKVIEPAIGATTGQASVTVPAPPVAIPVQELSKPTTIDRTSSPEPGSMFTIPQPVSSGLSMDYEAHVAPKLPNPTPPVSLTPSAPRPVPSDPDRQAPAVVLPAPASEDPVTPVVEPALEPEPILKRQTSDGSIRI